ncbi:MAG: glycosyltransferase [Kastovskya adunca ATA6-11-RM4]|jgi:glycosyltransferase involved in cell wall biosynthesis|nr:glycosyltransferase [Kastovskya adunca ATA6-11-RM4]
MPVVSVVVPAYNVEKTILETIRSIQQQTFSEFELIIINDGSKDGTLKLVNCINDPRIKVFSYENAGLPEARNRGIARSTGEFITFIDADDVWTADKIELQLAALQKNPEAGVAYSWTSFMDSEGKTFSKDQPVYFEGNVYPQLLMGNFINSGSNVMLRRQAIESVGKFDASLRSIEDWEYWLRLAAKWSFVLVPHYQILYRQSATSMASKVDVMEHYSLLVINRAFEAAPPELQHLKKRSLANTYQYLARLCITHAPDAEKINQGWKFLKKAVSLSPSVLTKRNTQRLLIKWLILRFLPQKTAQGFMQRFGKMKASNDPRLKA